MKTVRSEWDSYFEMVMPPGAHRAQLQETRRAFYAGAYAMLVAVTEAPSDDKSDEQVAEYYKALMQECREFNQAVQNGRA